MWLDALFGLLGRLLLENIPLPKSGFQACAILDIAVWEASVCREFEVLAVYENGVGFWI